MVIITAREAFDSEMPFDYMTIWVIVNLCFYFVEIVISWTMFKNLNRMNRQNYFRISVGVDLLRYIITISGFVLFYGQPGMNLKPNDRKNFNDATKTVVY